MSTTPRDPTFRAYNPDQASTYAAVRGSYPSVLYDAILSHHFSTGGSANLLVDVGCGPGNATRDLSPMFEHAIGVDPGAEMIAAANGMGGRTKGGGEVRFEVSGAEEISRLEGLEEGSVDLLIGAMAAHWFDMPLFWSEAAKVLKPGGTVALWTSASLYCHPSTPNAKDVQHLLFKFEREDLAPYETSSLRLSRDMYDNLPLPWEVKPAIAAFSREQFVRYEWDRDGVMTDGKDFLGGKEETSLGTLEKGMATASMVTRWRAANPELVGTESDVVRRLIKDLRVALGGQGSFVGGSSTALLLFKRSV